MKTSIYIAVSLDGFIAREDSGLDWLPSPSESTGEDYGFKAFFDSIDALVMGRNTFELVLSFGSWPYGDKPVVILTSRNIEIPDNLAKTVITMSGNPNEIIKKLSEQGYEHLYIDGGKTIQGFLENGLVDELTISRIPVLIGSGIPLFGQINKDIQLDHIETQVFGNGIVQSKYRVFRG